MIVMNGKHLATWMCVAGLLALAPPALAQQAVGTPGGTLDFGASLLDQCDAFLASVWNSECGGGIRIVFPWFAFLVTLAVAVSQFMGARRARQEQENIRGQAEREIEFLKKRVGFNETNYVLSSGNSGVKLFNTSASLIEDAISCLGEGESDPERESVILTLNFLGQLVLEEQAARGTELPAVGLRKALLDYIDRGRSVGDAPQGVEAIWRLAAVNSITNRFSNGLGLAIAAVAARSVFEAAHLHVPSIRLLTPRAALQSEWLWQASMLDPGSDTLNQLGRDAVRAVVSSMQAPEALIVDVARFPILHGNVVARSGHLVVLGPTNV